MPVLNKSIELNNGSTDESVDFPSPLVIPATGQAFTMGVWFKTLTVNQVVLVSKLYNGADYSWAIALGGSALYACQTAGVSNWAYRRNTGYDYRDGSWYFVAMVHDGIDWLNIALYIGGQGWRPIVGTGSVAIGSPATNGNLVVGGMRNVGVGWPLDGQVAGEFLYDKALSLAELNTIFNSGVPIDHTATGPTGNLKHWAKLGTGDALGTGNMLDSSAAALHGTFVNGDAEDFKLDAPGFENQYESLYVPETDAVIEHDFSKGYWTQYESLYVPETVVVREEEFTKTFVSFDAAAENAAPVVSNFLPPAGTTIDPTKSIQFDVTDDSGAFTRIIVTVTMDGITEVVHDGEQFRGLFAGASQRWSITDGFRYAVARQGGWTAPPTFETFAIDQQGAEAV